MKALLHVRRPYNAILIIIILMMSKTTSKDAAGMRRSLRQVSTKRWLRDSEYTFTVIERILKTNPKYNRMYATVENSLNPTEASRLFPFSNPVEDLKKKYDKTLMNNVRN